MTSGFSNDTTQAMAWRGGKAEAGGNWPEAGVKHCRQLWFSSARAGTASSWDSVAFSRQGAVCPRGPICTLPSYQPSPHPSSEPAAPEHWEGAGSPGWPRGRKQQKPVRDTGWTDLSPPWTAMSAPPVGTSCSCPLLRTGPTPTWLPVASSQTHQESGF